MGILCHYKLESTADGRRCGAGQAAAPAAAAAAHVGSGDATGTILESTPKSLKRSLEEERRLRAEAALKRFKSQSSTPTSSSSSSSEVAMVTVAVAKVPIPIEVPSGKVVIDLAEDSDPEDGWACSACTFLNVDIDYCEMCGTRREII
jgi:hypothetical protein